ncbi:MAG: ABC transporter ATP-binding protein [Jeotgalicoccus sp.]|nr:ABC transporter ATP-binding protein [Jeotgalicoccus sp.]
MITASNLTKNFGGKTAVKNINISVKKGELFAYLGPNGSGKSTTIKMLMGLLEPTEGTVEILGEPMHLNNTELKRKISFVPDTPDIIGKLTGNEYLNFVASIYKMDKKTYTEKRNELVNMFELQNDLGTLVEEYSHGMRQKLVVIGALMHSPEVIFLDEPNVGLDPKSNRELKNYLTEYVKQGNTVFLTTHTLSLAEEIADRICIIYKGEIKALGTLEELAKKAGSGEKTLEDIFLALTGEEDVHVQKHTEG